MPNFIAVLEEMHTLLDKDLNEQWSAYALGSCFGMLFQMIDNAPEERKLLLQNIQSLFRRQDARSPIDVRIEARDALAEIITTCRAMEVQ